MGEVRIDKWLWAARLFKSRTLAAAACDGGKVDVNDQAVKPSRIVRPGDLLTVTLPRGKRIVRVSTVAERRGPAPQAAGLYEDLTPPPPPRELRAAPGARLYPTPAGGGGGGPRGAAPPPPGAQRRLHPFPRPPAPALRIGKNGRIQAEQTC
jgi:ribosome-associated heat shock protein Hsp15